jgi:REP element-mobilizing transposase RayT
MVTRRCLERRFFLRPDREMTEAFIYCLAAAARRTNVRVIFSSVMPNHHHTGIVDVEGRLPEFLEYLHKFVAKCGNALRGRWESFWAPEQTSCVELLGPDDILEKMVYAITNPVKDGLVEHTTDWPGLDCLAAIDKDVPLVAERPRHFFRPDTSLPERETLIFVRPPGFEDLSHGQWFARVREAVTAVEQSAAAERQSLGRKALGAKAVLRQHWDDSPSSREPRRVLSPRVAAKNKWARVEALMRNKWLIRS